MEISRSGLNGLMALSIRLAMKIGLSLVAMTAVGLGLWLLDIPLDWSNLKTYLGILLLTVSIRFTIRV